MHTEAQTLFKLIQSRRAIFPKSYTGQEIPKEWIEMILESANYAPTHRLTEPWRFVVITGDARQRLADYLVADYRANTPEAEQSDVKAAKMAENPMRSACIIGIYMERHPDLLPEWEEVAAVAMAVQNMWLCAAALGLGAYWSSPAAMVKRGQEFLQISGAAQCLGLFYMGFHEAPDMPAKRTPISEKVIWL